MRASGTVALCALFGLMACDVSGARSVVVPGPEGDTIVVAAMTDDGPVFLSVWHESLSAQRASAELAERSDFRIYRLEYPGTPADWDLTEGDLPLREGGPRGLDLPATIQRSSVSPAGQGPWITLDELPEEIARLRLDLPERSKCLDLAWEEVPLPVEGDFRAALSVDDAHVLIVVVRPDGTQTFFRYSANGLEPISLPGITESFPKIHAGARDARGKIWLASKRDGIWHGDLETGFTQTSTQELGHARMKLATPTVPGANEGLYVWTAGRVLHRFENNRVELLGDMKGVDADFWFGLEWLAPGEVIAVSGDLPEYLHLKDGETRRQSAPDKLHSILRDSRGQVYAGSLLGSMWTWTGGAWERFARVGDARILNIAELPMGAGLLLGGGHGEFLQYIHENEETCTEQLGTSDIGALIPYEGGAVLWPNYPEHNDAQQLSVVRFPDSR